MKYIHSLLICSVLLLSPLMVMAQAPESSPLATVNAASKDVCACLEWPYQAMRDSMGEVREAQVNGNFSQIQSVQNKLLTIDA